MNPQVNTRSSGRCNSLNLFLSQDFQGIRGTFSHQVAGLLSTYAFAKTSPITEERKKSVNIF